MSKLNRALLALAVLLTTALVAQTFGPPMFSFGAPVATSLSQCTLSGAHAATICPVETGAGTGMLYVSINGSAWTAIAPGVQGPAGPAGATGPQGAPGVPALGQSYSETCNNATVSSSTPGLVTHSCTATVP